MLDPDDYTVAFGKMRCLHALGEWEHLSDLVQQKWGRADMDDRRHMAPLAAAAAWSLGQWDTMDDYISAMRSDSSERSFYRAILHTHRSQRAAANKQIAKARESLDSELTALISESYGRAYDLMVRTQMLSELEEALAYKLDYKEQPDRQATIRSTWMKRLQGCQPEVELPAGVYAEPGRGSGCAHGGRARQPGDAGLAVFAAAGRVCASAGSVLLQAGRVADGAARELGHGRQQQRHRELPARDRARPQLVQGVARVGAGEFRDHLAPRGEERADHAADDRGEHCAVGAGLLPLDRAGERQQSAGHAASADAVVQVRPPGGRVAGGQRGFRERDCGHVARGDPADYCAHHGAVAARATADPQSAVGRGTGASAGARVSAHRGGQESEPHAHPGGDGHHGQRARALARAGGAGAARVQRAHPRRHPVARDVARGTRRGVAPLLYRAQHRRHVCHARAAARCARKGARDAARDVVCPDPRARSGRGARVRPKVPPVRRHFRPQPGMGILRVAEAAGDARSGAGGAGHVPVWQADRVHHAVRADCAGDRVQAAPSSAQDEGFRRAYVPVPAQGPRGLASGRAGDAAVRAGQHAALDRFRELQAAAGDPAVPRHPALAQHGHAGMGGEYGYAACAHQGVPRAAQDPAQH
ncbi:hypothetical protein L1887_62720 [Cichorium endivia]|nr:hypothetical protein L1887_62720 [Cichorium endivia]